MHAPYIFLQFELAQPGIACPDRMLYNLCQEWMNDYDFSRLNDKEFEVLCTDLIGAQEGVRFERSFPILQMRPLKEY